jgi:hypothetical protein
MAARVPTAQPPSSRVTTRPSGTVAKALLAKGMVTDNNHHEMYRKSLPEADAHLVTRISHGSKEVGNVIGKLMARQLCLRTREFWQLVDCDLSEEGWNALVAERCDHGRNPFMGRG